MEVNLLALTTYIFSGITFFIFRKSILVYLLWFTLGLHLYYLLSCLVFDFGYHVPIFNDFDGRKIYYILASLSCIWFSLGVVHAAGFTPGKKIPLYKQRFQLLKNAWRQPRQYNLSIKILATLLVLISFVLVGANADFQDLVFRKETFVDIPLYPMALLDVLFWPISVLLPFIRQRSWRWSLTLSYFCLFFGLGERQAFVLLVIYSAIRKLVLNQSTIKFIFLIAISAVVLSILILVRYGERESGIIGMLSYLGEGKELLSFGLLSFNYITNFTVFTIGNSIVKFSGDPGLIFYSLNPLPSFILNDENYLGSFDLQPHVPYSGVAMVYNSFGILGVYSVGLWIGILIKLANKIGFNGSQPRVLIFIIAFAPTIFMFQYNLRAGMRLAYYLLFFSTLAGLMIRVRLGREKQ